MANRGKAPAGRPMTLVWMVLALVVVGGFLTWLGVVSEPTTVAVVENEEENDLGGPGTHTRVARDTLAESRARFVGQEIQVDGVQSTGRLGPGIFWGELGDLERQVPILVRMEPEVAAAADVQAGVEYTIRGVIREVTEAQVAEWAAAGEFAGEGEELQATFADYYIEASMVRPAMRR